VLFRSRRVGCGDRAGVSNAQSMVEHCTVPSICRFCRKSAASNPLYSVSSTPSFRYSGTPLRGVDRDVSQVFTVPTISNKFGEIDGDVDGPRLYRSVQGLITRFRVSTLSTGSGPRSRITAPYFDHYPRSCLLFWKAATRQKAIRSSRGTGRYRRACRSGIREHALSDEIRAVSVRAPNADRFRRPRRAGFSASLAVER
jgi:hypothetical protein